MIKKFEQFTNTLFGWHVTRRSNIPSIVEQGLIPKIPEDYGKHGDTKAVYLFKTPDDASTAMSQWMGDRIEDWEEEHDEEYDEIVLKVDLTGFEKDLHDTVEFEWTCLRTIPPERIISVHEPSWTIEKNIIKTF